MARLARETGVELNHVPYRGSAPALNDLLAGSVEAMVIDYAAGGEYLRSGRVRPLAVCSAARLAACRTCRRCRRRSGCAASRPTPGRASCCRSGTPDPVGRAAVADLAAALRDEAAAARMRELGVEPLPGGPGEFQALHRGRARGLGAADPRSRHHAGLSGGAGDRASRAARGGTSP